MALSTMSAREQILILVIVATVFGGAYGVLRYAPQQKVLNGLGLSLQKSIDHIKNPKFPEVPDEDAATLKEKVELTEERLVNLRAQLESFEQNLPPTDSQDVLLKISEAARTAGVKVIESVPYIVKRRDGEDVDVTVNKLNKRAARKLAKTLRKKARLANRRGTNTQQAGAAGMVGATPKEGELIDRLVNDLEEDRPLQRISVEGAFDDLQQFIQSLEAMPWQVTIVKLDIDVNIQTPPPGIPQPIMAKMIIAR